MQEQLEEAAEQQQQEAGQAEARQAGLRQALAAQESRAGALAAELASRPASEEVRSGRCSLTWQCIVAGLGGGSAVGENPWASKMDRMWLVIRYSTGMV